MGEWLDPWAMTEPATVPDLIRSCGGTVHEARLRMRQGTPREVRVVVAFGTVDQSSRFRSAVTGLGATLEGNPSGLANGHPLPLGSVVSFSMPATSAGALLALAP